MNIPEKKSIESASGQQPFIRFTIAKKMLIGYLGLSLVIVLIASLVLSSLRRMNDINSDVISVDAPIVEIADKMGDIIFAEDLYGHRYMQSRNADDLQLYKKETAGFQVLVEKLMELPGKKSFSISKLESLHSAYDAAFQNVFDQMGNPNFSRTDTVDKRIRAKRKDLTIFIKKISSEAIWSQSKKSRLSSQIGESEYQSVIILGIIAILIALAATGMITRNIVGSIRKLKLATRQIARGEFENLPVVESADELGELSRSFSEMARRLKQLEQILVDMSPLTRMPGNISIENTLRKRLNDGGAIAFCHFDLDNFKAFGDKYGYAMGSEVIKATARTIESAVSAHGSAEDFMGHIGGDDFVVITHPERYEAICCHVIEAFDKIAPDFYSIEDRTQGFIMGKTRQGEEMAFPLMTISIGVVTNRERELKDPLQVGELAAELKECAKACRGSSYVADKPIEDNL